MSDEEINTVLKKAMQAIADLPKNQNIRYISSHYTSLINSLSLFDEWLQHAVDQKSVRYNAVVNAMTPEERFYELQTQTNIHDFEVFSLNSTMLNSKIVQIWSAFESFCHQFCFTLQRELKIPVSIDKFKVEKKGFLNGFEKYLVDMVKMDIDEFSEDWKDIKRFYFIRNIAVHSSGYLDLTDSRNKSFLKYINTRSDINLIKNEDLPDFYAFFKPEHLSVLMVGDEYIRFIADTTMRYIKCISKRTDNIFT